MFFTWINFYWFILKRDGLWSCWVIGTGYALDKMDHILVIFMIELLSIYVCLVSKWINFDWYILKRDGPWSCWVIGTGRALVKIDHILVIFTIDCLSIILYYCASIFWNNTKVPVDSTLTLATLFKNSEIKIFKLVCSDVHHPA